MLIIRQSTDSQQIALGPLVQWDEDAEALVPYTGTVANTDIRILKAGATSEVSKSSGSATHVAGGLYRAAFSAADTDTLGPISIRIGISGAEPFVLRATVVPAAVYDSLVGGTGNGIRGQVINLGAQAAAVLAAAVENPIHADMRKVNGNDVTPVTDVAKESSVQEIINNSIRKLEVS